ncbi:7652_t:CDS:2, partial [Acaulospora morrowiae]
QDRIEELSNMFRKADAIGVGTMVSETGGFSEYSDAHKNYYESVLECEEQALKAFSG